MANQHFKHIGTLDLNKQIQYYHADNQATGQSVLIITRFEDEDLLMHIGYGNDSFVDYRFHVGEPNENSAFKVIVDEDNMEVHPLNVPREGMKLVFKANDKQVEFKEFDTEGKPSDKTGIFTWRDENPFN